MWSLLNRMLTIFTSSPQHLTDPSSTSCTGASSDSCQTAASSVSARRTNEPSRRKRRASSSSFQVSKKKRYKIEELRDQSSDAQNVQDTPHTYAMFDSGDPSSAALHAGEPPNDPILGDRCNSMICASRSSTPSLSDELTSSDPDFSIWTAGHSPASVSELEETEGSRLARKNSTGRAQGPKSYVQWPSC